MYQLNLLKPNQRVKVRAFLPQQNRKNLAFVGNSQQTFPFTTFSYETDRSKIENQYALNKFQDKFYGKVPISSQLNQKKGLKTIDIFERTRAKSYSMP